MCIECVYRVCIEGVYRVCVRVPRVSTCVRVYRVCVHVCIKCVYCV